MIIDFSGIKGRVQSVSAGRVTVDFNNPLAGRKLKYEVTVTEQITELEKQIKAILEFFGIEKPEVKISGGVAEIETAKLPTEMKERISKLILEHVKPAEPLDKIKFVEVFGKS